MPARILVVAEGEHELGDASSGNGSLIVLIRRLLADQTELLVECRPIKSFKRHLHGKGNGLYKKLVAIVQEAAKDGFEAVVILIDQDADTQRQYSASEAQISDFVSLPRAIGVAVETYDAWFLADHRALSAELKVDIQRQPNPEAERQPKENIRRLLEAHSYQGKQRDFYTSLAGRLDITELSHRCPRGFASFHQRVTELSQQLRQ